MSSLNLQKVIDNPSKLRNIPRLAKIAFLLSVATVDSFAAPLTLYYASPIGEENWHMTGSRLRCGLALTVPNYGVAYFEQYAAKPAHFILSNWQQVDRQRPAVVFAKPPVWKPGGQVFLVTKTSVNPGEYAVYLPRNETIKLLNYLAEGYQTSFQYLSEQGFPISVSLSPIRFQEVYSRYQRCLGNLLPFDYTDVKISVLLFDTDSFELSDDSKEQLKKVAQYCKADRLVKKVKIAGYTDNTGRKGYNNAISEARAKSVREFLLSLGLQEGHLAITWYGVKNPSAPNDTDVGKRVNRRVVVKIIK
ncbi:sodium-type flagellar protein [Legionella nautarum]|uniref:Sodium-type flagellar protein n=1 Tax=Legionella nautarum TaxID=45070 RepID=A0A0W0X1R1_9GAMM|nr:OmpA family protein [Legionella nautarum]KTD38501.1 sodium-type flagellar protein [Legionella nautarum]